MTILTWEHLAKNQTESETIEEAIIRIVAEHEADPTSHMGPGESIDVHRKNEIIDHKPGSVLNDKLSMSEISYYSTFEDLDKFNIHGDVSMGFYRTVKISTTDTDIDNNWITSEFSMRGNIVDFSKDIQFEISLYTDFLTNNGKYFLVLGTDGSDRLEGFGFEILNGNLKGGFRNSFEVDGYCENLINFGNCIDIGIIKLRLQYIAGEKIIYGYLNGNLMGQVNLTYLDREILEEYLPYFKAKKISGANSSLYLIDFGWSVGL